jgi:C1A family cysteine protease
VPYVISKFGTEPPARRFVIRNSWGTTWGSGGYWTNSIACLPDENNPG